MTQYLIKNLLQKAFQWSSWAGVCNKLIVSNTRITTVRDNPSEHLTHLLRPLVTCGGILPVNPGLDALKVRMSARGVEAAWGAMVRRVRCFGGGAQRRASGRRGQGHWECDVDKLLAPTSPWECLPLPGRDGPGRWNRRDLPKLTAEIHVATNGTRWIHESDSLRGPVSKCRPYIMWLVPTLGKPGHIFVHIFCEQLSFSSLWSYL